MQDRTADLQITKQTLYHWAIEAHIYCNLIHKVKFKSKIYIPPCRITSSSTPLTAFASWWCFLASSRIIYDADARRQELELAFSHFRYGGGKGDPIVIPEKKTSYFRFRNDVHYTTANRLARASPWALGEEFFAESKKIIGEDQNSREAFLHRGQKKLSARNFSPRAIRREFFSLSEEFFLKKIFFTFTFFYHQHALIQRICSYWMNFISVCYI
jgi:hypothetical protein